MGIRPVLTPGEVAARILWNEKHPEAAQSLEHWMMWLDSRYVELHTHYTCFVEAVKYRSERDQWPLIKKIVQTAVAPDKMKYFRYDGQAPTFPPDFLQKGDFTLHSGQKSTYKIECDALSFGSWEAAAVMAVELLPPFGRVVGVPRGGLPFANALSRHITPDCPTTLIAEDIVTTGASMEKIQEAVVPHGEPYIGVALICRGKCPEWVVPIFQKTQPKVV